MRIGIRLATCLEKIFGVLFITFSLFLVYCSVEKWRSARIGAVSVFSILCVLFLFCILLVQSGNIVSQKRRINVVYIFILSLCIHLFAVLLFGQDIEQVSDFKSALETADLDFPLTENIVNYRVFSNWAIYPIYLKLLQMIFGYGSLTGMIFNAVLSAIASALIYVICVLWFNNDKIGHMSALLYTLWPSNLFYIVILTPEFVNITLTLAFFVLLGMIIRYRNTKYVYGLVILSAIDLCLSGFFKSIDKIILVDMCIVVFLLLIKGESLRLPDHKKIIKSTFFFVVLFVFSYFMSNKVIYAGLDYAYGTTLNRNPAAHFICVGLNPETYGMWNETWGGVYTKNAIESGFDFDEATSLTFQRLRQQIEEKDYLTSAYFVEKFKIAWADLSSELWWTDYSLKEDGSFLMKERWSWQMINITQSFWVLICFFICIDAFFLFKKTEKYHLVICMLLFGFALLLVISEVQGRYKCVIYPYMSILAAEGIERVTSFTSSVLQKVLHHK